MSITLTINDTSITNFETNSILNKVFGNSIKNSFKSFDLVTKNENGVVVVRLLIMVMKKIWMYSQERDIYR